ncbi:MAG: hypothetical protein JXR86_10130, partial [Spirochaetales bacterium]|nr:hypothetical protein [Spirochaetales bacterium]
MKEEDFLDGIKIFPLWENIKLTEQYSVSFRLAGENILLSLPVGDSSGEGLSLFLVKRKEFLQEIGLYDRIHIELKDYSQLQGKVSKNNRMIFTRHLLEEKKRGCLLGLMGFNGPPFIRWSFELGKRLYSRDFPLHLYKTFDEAMKEALLLL